jgi:hypothetical protein
MMAIVCFRNEDTTGRDAGGEDTADEDIFSNCFEALPSTTANEPVESDRISLTSDSSLASESSDDELQDLNHDTMTPTERVHLQNIVWKNSTPHLLDVFALAGLPLSLPCKFTYLLERYGNVVFVNANAKLVRKIWYQFNCTDPLFDVHTSEPHVAESTPGRSVSQDADDIVFIYRSLEPYVFAGIWTSWIGRRCRGIGGAAGRREQIM